MKIEVKKVDALRRELKFEIPKDRVNQKLNQVYDEIGRVAKIKGYRPGRAPRHLVEAQHGKVAQEETIKQLIPEVYHEGLEKENLNPLELPDIEEVSFKDGMITFTAKFDVKPEIKLKDYKGMKVTRKSSQVTDEEIDKTLEFFKKGKGEQEITIDDAFAHGLGYPNLEELKIFLRRQMELDKDRQNRIDIENQVVDHLLEQTKFTVPASLVKKQLDRRVAETKRHLKSHGMTEEEMNKKEEEMRKSLQESVERDIRAYLVFDKIAELENISAGENESLPAKVMEFLLKEAKWEAQ